MLCLLYALYWGREGIAEERQKYSDIKNELLNLEKCSGPD